jgi:hypothetical protein
VRQLGCDLPMTGNPTATQAPEVLRFFGSIFAGFMV